MSSNLTPFTQGVIKAIEAIPKGFVASYGFIAMLAGNSHSGRIVGYLTHSLRLNLPYHRVVFKDGSICPGSQFGHPDIQREMLLSEGVVFLPNGRVNMSKSAWDGKSYF